MPVNLSETNSMAFTAGTRIPFYCYRLTEWVCCALLAHHLWLLRSRAVGPVDKWVQRQKHAHLQGIETEAESPSKPRALDATSGMHCNPFENASLARVFRFRAEEKTPLVSKERT